MPPLDLQINDLARELLLPAMMLAGPVLLVGLIVGISVILVQSRTAGL